MLKRCSKRFSIQLRRFVSVGTERVGAAHAVVERIQRQWEGTGGARRSSYHCGWCCRRFADTANIVRAAWSPDGAHVGGACPICQERFSLWKSTARYAQNLAC